MNLHRAIVSLPRSLCERDQPCQDRVVFFEPPCGAHASTHLAQLLALAWDVSAEQLGDGCIYNVNSEREVIDYAFAEADTGDMRLFETGCGGAVGLLLGMDPVRIHFARAADVDLFVAPRTHKRLMAAMTRIEEMFVRQETFA